MPNLLKHKILVGGLALCGAFMGVPASASVFAGIAIQSFSIENTYSYAFGDMDGQRVVGGEKSTFYQSDQRPVPSSQLGVDFVGQASADSFYFLHNDYCVGHCQITSSTTIRFEIQNVSGQDLDGVRFDSLITPGHLGFVALGDYQSTSASFEFTVNKTDLLAGEGFGESENLYNAYGYANNDGLSISVNDSSNLFNGSRSGNNGGAGSYLDWDATPLNLELGQLAARQTIFVDYTATYTVRSFNKCDDILNCNGAQVVFGDPRNTGGGTDQFAASLARGAFVEEPEVMAFEAGSTIDGGVHAVINRDYEASYIPFAFVLSSSPPTFETPEPGPNRNYIGNYDFNLQDTDTSSAVPEPATWATMVLGFAVIGRALRRRRAGFGKVVA